MAGGGGAWKVAYADFVTAMMAFFMVMWLTAQDSEVKEAVEGYFRDPWAKYSTNHNDVRRPTLVEPKTTVEASKKKANGSNARQTPHDDPESPENKQPRFVTMRSNERTTTGTMVPFEPHRSELTKEAQQKLVNLIPQLTGITHKIDLRGHVSTKEFAESESEEAGWRLAFARCVSVMEFLESKGIPSDRMRPSVAGPHEPISIGANEADLRKNSRVEVFLLPERTDGFKGTAEERKKLEIPAAIDVSPTSSGGEKHGGGH